MLWYVWRFKNLSCFSICPAEPCPCRIVCYACYSGYFLCAFALHILPFHHAGFVRRKFAVQKISDSISNIIILGAKLIKFLFCLYVSQIACFLRVCWRCLHALRNGSCRVLTYAPFKCHIINLMIYSRAKHKRSVYKLVICHHILIHSFPVCSLSLTCLFRTYRTLICRTSAHCLWRKDTCTTAHR